MKNSILMKVYTIGCEMIDAVAEGNKKRAEKCFDRAHGMIEMIATAFSANAAAREEDALILLDCAARGLYDKLSFKEALASIYADESFNRDLLGFKAALSENLSMVHNALEQNGVNSAIESFDALCSFGVTVHWITAADKIELHQLVFDKDLANECDASDCRKKIGKVIPFKFYEQNLSIDRRERKDAPKVGDLAKEIFEKWIAVDTTTGALDRTKKGTEFHDYLKEVKGTRCYSSELAFFYDKLTSDGDKYSSIVDLLIKWGYEV